MLINIFQTIVTIIGSILFYGSYHIFLKLGNVNKIDLLPLHLLFTTMMMIWNTLLLLFIHTFYIPGEIFAFSFISSLVFTFISLSILTITTKLEKYINIMFSYYSSWMLTSIFMGYVLRNINFINSNIFSVGISITLIGFIGICILIDFHQRSYRGHECINFFIVGAFMGLAQTLMFSTFESFSPFVFQFAFMFFMFTWILSCLINATSFLICRKDCNLKSILIQNKDQNPTIKNITIVLSLIIISSLFCYVATLFNILSIVNIGFIVGNSLNPLAFFVYTIWEMFLFQIFHKMDFQYKLVYLFVTLITFIGIICIVVSFI